MTDLCRKNIRVWLRDAHAMEEQAEQLFSGQANRLKGYLSSYENMEFEISCIKKHQIMLSIRIQQLGSAPSMIKNTAARMFAETKNITASIMNDEPVTVMFRLHISTQTAIGLYKILIVAAEAVNDQETKQVCLNILEQTEARADWITVELARVTKNFLSKIP